MKYIFFLFLFSLDEIYKDRRVQSIYILQHAKRLV